VVGAAITQASCRSLVQKGYRRVEETTFDTLLRKAAQQTSRRGALGALFGGVLLLNNRGEIEATKQAKRRKRRKRRDRPGTRIIKPTTVEVDNTAGQAPVTIRWGWHVQCCMYSSTVTVPAGQRMTINSPDAALWMWIGNMYWFLFENVLFARPLIRITIYGTYFPPFTPGCCDIPVGDTVEQSRSFKENVTRTYNIENRALFTVTRRPDLRTRKSWLLRLPPVLPDAPLADD